MSVQKPTFQQIMLRLSYFWAEHAKIDVENSQKPTEVYVPSAYPDIAFGNDFQVDVDFDGEGTRSFLAGLKPSVQGQPHVFQVGRDGRLTERGRMQLPETNAGYKYKGMDGVPSMPLGIWAHPTESLLYVGFVTRNELGVYRFAQDGDMAFLGSVENSGQDICWLLTNKKGTRLYTVNNLPRSDKDDKAAPVITYDIAGDELSPEVAAFIAEQDACFLATACAEGQPYIQHRGGPRGFLRVLDPRTIAFADFTGNRQYISVGNLAENPRVHLFLLDHARRRRIKVWGTAAVDDDPALLARLADPAYDAEPERAIVITVTAWDVNCPQHIPQRIDAADVARALADRDRRIAELEARVAELTRQS